MPERRGSKELVNRALCAVGLLAIGMMTGCAGEQVPGEVGVRPALVEPKPTEAYPGGAERGEVVDFDKLVWPEGIKPDDGVPGEDMGVKVMTGSTSTLEPTADVTPEPEVVEPITWEEYYQGWLGQLIQQPPEVGGIENFRVPLMYGVGFGTHYMPEVWGMHNALYQMLKLRHMIYLGEMTYDDLPAYAKLLIDHLDAHQFLPDKVEFITDAGMVEFQYGLLVEENYVYNHWLKYVVDSQQGMSEEEVLESGVIIGCVATRAAADIGYRYLMYGLNEQGEWGFLGAVLAVDSPQEEHWIGGVPERPEGLHVWRYGEYSWIADVTTEAFVQAGRVNGELSKDPNLARPVMLVREDVYRWLQNNYERMTGKPVGVD